MQWIILLVVVLAVIIWHLTKGELDEAEDGIEEENLEDIEPEIAEETIKDVEEDEDIEEEVKEK